MNHKPIIISLLSMLTLLLATCLWQGCRRGKAIDTANVLGPLRGIRCTGKEKPGEFWEYTCPTTNVTPGFNRVKGVVLHHTATFDTNAVLRDLTGAAGSRRASCHVVIDRDGTRYVLGDPTAITWHAGRSRWRGREWCNLSTIGIEFLGNTLKAPLTDEQIRSAWEYLSPIMAKHGLTARDITTHAEIRQAYNKAHPQHPAAGKVDITDRQFRRLLDARPATVRAK